jgi:hypothetical protein
MGFIEVKNKKGTSDRRPPASYSSWLDFWEKKKGTKAARCEAMLCNGKPDVGGHVIKAGESSKEYILPLCHEHNNKPDNELFMAWENDLMCAQ